MLWALAVAVGRWGLLDALAVAGRRSLATEPPPHSETAPPGIPAGRPTRSRIAWAFSGKAGTFRGKANRGPSSRRRGPLGVEPREGGPRMVATSPFQPPRLHEGRSPVKSRRCSPNPLAGDVEGFTRAGRYSRRGLGGRWPPSVAPPGFPRQDAILLSSRGRKPSRFGCVAGLLSPPPREPGPAASSRLPDPDGPRKVRQWMRRGFSNRTAER